MQYIIEQKQLPRIVFDPNAPEPVRFAADELERYLKILLSAEKADISTRQSINLELNPNANLTDEGYELIAESPDLFRICGGGPAGVLYGVYDFLRRYCGCRFSGYAPDGEYVPCRERVAIPEGTMRMKPDLWYRGLQFSTAGATDRQLMIKRLDWMAKNGMNYVMITPQPDLLSDDEEATTIDPETGRVMEINAFGRYTNGWFRSNLLPEVLKRGLKVDMNHSNLFYWLPPGKYYDEHPEWFALVNGERSRKPMQLCICTSNRQAVRTLIENVLQYLRENPETRIVGVIVEDGLGMCQCDECRKLDVNPTDAERPYMGHRKPEGENRSKTRRYALLLNEVARAVRMEYPQVKVGGVGYVDMQWPPRDVKLESNIVMMVAIYWRCGAHELGPDACAMNRLFWDILEQWRASQSCEIILYEYYMGMNGQRGMVYPLAEVLVREWPRLKKLGIGGATVQSYDGHHNTYALNYLAFARSGWEAHVDFTRLRQGFLQGMFGSLADVVRPVYDALERQVKVLEEKGSDSPFVQPIPPAVGCLLPNASNIAFLLEALDVPAAIARIEAAMRNDGNERERRQAADFLDALRFWNMAAEMFRAAQAITEAERRGDLDNARQLALQALAINTPEWNRCAALPPRGWILIRDKFWQGKTTRGNFSWMKEKAGNVP